MKQFNIVSEDGTVDTTKVFFGDEPVAGITNINISIDANDPFIACTFTVMLPKFNIAIDKAEVKLINFELDSAFTKEPAKHSIT